MLTGPTEMLDQMLKNAQIWLMAADEALPIYRDGEVRVLKLADAKRAIKEVQAIVGLLARRLAAEGSAPLARSEIFPGYFAG